jgi:hypothetical protein
MELIRLRKRAKDRLEKNEIFLKMAQEFNWADNHQKAKALFDRMGYMMKSKKKWEKIAAALATILIFIFIILVLIARQAT